MTERKKERMSTQDIYRERERQREAEKENKREGESQGQTGVIAA